ncbi:hypothetical protein [Fodinicurvata halophila]
MSDSEIDHGVALGREGISPGQDFESGFGSEAIQRINSLHLEVSQI